MYREAEKAINAGLSLGARALLAFLSSLFGVVILLVAPPTDKAIFFYAFGGFCLALAILCLVTGRLRQFIGSVFGSGLFALSIWYAADQLIYGTELVGPKSEPNLLNSCLFIMFIGIPGASYAFKAKFGFKKSEPASEEDV